MASDGQRPRAHGCTVIDSRFSLIIRPQSAVGGCRPKPRKLTAAMIAIEYVMRRPISTISGPVTFGSSSPKMIRERFSPTASAALMKSRSTTSCAGAAHDARHARRVREADASATSSHSFGPIAETASSARTIGGNASSDVVAAHQHVVEPVARVGGDEPDRRCRRRCRRSVAAADSQSTVSPP